MRTSKGDEVSEASRGAKAKFESDGAESSFRRWYRFWGRRGALLGGHRLLFLIGDDGRRLGRVDDKI